MSDEKGGIVEIFKSRYVSRNSHNLGGNTIKIMANRKSLAAPIMGIAALSVFTLVINVAAARMSSTISLGLGQMTTTASADSEYTTESNYLEGYEASVDAMSEGSVLLKNKDNILPLEEGTNVTLFGAGSYNYILGGTGSAGGKDDEYTISMYDAFSEAGLYINDDVWQNLEYACGSSRNTKSRYGNSEYSYFVQGKDDDNGWASYKKVHEFSSTVNETNILKNGDAVGKNYGDYVIYTISRSGAEGASPSMDYDGDGSTLTGTTYLELSQDEKDALSLCKKYFKHTIVLINSSTPMELGFVDSEAYNIDAALWIGHPGEAGLVGVGYVLTGIVNPSGALVDTYAYDLSTTPSYYNTDDNKYTNSGNQTFYQYEEGIYVGYRYYETAASEGYFDSNEFKQLKFKGTDGTSKTEGGTKTGQASYTGGYDSVVQYPFGYGLSYTTFSQKITASDIKLEAHGTNSITVEVTNTGSVAGKEIVQLYMEAPYDNDDSLGIKGKGLEKSKVVLIGYQKTNSIEPGKTETVTINFNTDDLASYDNYGKGCYVLEKGTYKFNIQDNAHDWGNAGSNNAPYDTKTAELASTIVYNADGVSARDSDKTIAENAMEDVDAGDGNMLDGYLSRSDFAGGMATIMQHESDEAANETLGANQAAALAVTGTDVYDYVYTTYNNGVKITKTEKTYAYGSDAAPWMEVLPDGTNISDFLDGKITTWGNTYYVLVNASDEPVLTEDTDGDETYDDFNLYKSESDIPADKLALADKARLVTIKDMSGVDADNEKWNQIASMVTLAEAIEIQGNCGWSTPAVESVGKAAQTCQDGPAEPNNGGSDMVTWYPSAVVIASTWNPDIAFEYGESYGHWCKILNIGAAYGPSNNLHRSPFGGRNFEYYSEDGYLSGIMAGSSASGIMSTGTSVYMKHFALNDGDTNRGGNTTWASEQAIRELYLKAYEIPVKTYKIDGIMGSLNRIGMSWAHYGMYTTVLRDEWGFNGHLITDGDGSTTSLNYNNPVFWLAGCQGSILNNGCYVNADTMVSAYGTTAYTSDFGQYLLQTTAKHLLYQYGTSAMTEGNFAYWWIPILAVCDTVIVLGIAAIATFGIALPLVKSKKKEAASAE